MNYHQAEQFLFAWAKLGRKGYMSDPNQCSVYLKRLQFFLDLISNPEKKIPHYIHVAGTSGKGSVCLMLDSILREKGLKTGTMTSPGTGMLQTRWQINGRVMSKIELAKILTTLKPKLEKYLKTSPYDPISYFELLTAVGLYWFAKRKVEWGILEAGCGGRYDSTNVIPYKDIAVITNVGFDHIDILGKTKEKIAYEKSGIIKRGCKVFTMETNKKILKIFKKEIQKYEKNINKILNKYYDIKYLILNISLQGIKFKYKENDYFIPNIGEHQIKNAILAIEVAKTLKIPEDEIKKGLVKVKLPLRMEIVSKKPLIILDSAHNPDKMRTTVETIKTKLIPFPPLVGEGRVGLHLVVGFSADKDINKMIKQLASLKPASIACARYTANPFRQSADSKLIAKMFRELKLKTKTKIFSNPIDALKWSKKQNKKRETILITGSMYLASEIKKLTLW